MVAGRINRQLFGNFQEFIPFPGFFWVVGGWFDVGLLENIRIIINVGCDPTRADAEPFTIDRTTVGLLRFDEIIGCPHQRITRNFVGDV